MDGLTIKATVFELNNCLCGARVDKINQPENDELHILAKAVEQRLILADHSCVEHIPPVKDHICCKEYRKVH